MNFFTAFLLLALGHAVHATYETPMNQYQDADVTCEDTKMKCVIPDHKYMTLASAYGYGNEQSVRDWTYEPDGFETGLPASCLSTAQHAAHGAFTFEYNKHECGMARAYGVGMYADQVTFVPDLSKPQYPNYRMFDDEILEGYSCTVGDQIMLTDHSTEPDPATRQQKCANTCLNAANCWGFTDFGTTGCRYCPDLTQMNEETGDDSPSYRKELIKGTDIATPSPSAAVSLEFAKSEEELKVYQPPKFVCTCQYAAITSSAVVEGTIVSQEVTFEDMETENLYKNAGAVTPTLQLMTSDYSSTSLAVAKNPDGTYAQDRWYLQASTALPTDVLSITNCGASSAEGAPQVQLLNNCAAPAVFSYKKYDKPNSDDDTLAGATNQGRISFRLFKFDDSDNMLFSCSVDLCENRPCGSCASRRLTKINKTGKNPLRKLQRTSGTGETQTLSVKTKFHPEADYITIPTTKDMYGRSKWTKQDTKNSLLNAVFGSDKADKLKTTSLFVKSSVKSYAHGKVEGSISLPGSTATLWATNTNARSSLEASLKQSMNLNNGEHVHITNVAEVSVQARGRSLMAKLTKQKLSSNMKNRRLQTATSVAQVDYTIELASASSPSFVETAVMGLALDRKIAGTFATTLNSELAKRGLPAQSVTADSLKFGMPTVQLSAASQQQATQNQAAAQQQNTVVRDSQPATTQVQTASSSGDDMKLLVLGALGLAGVIVVLAGAYQLMNKK